MLKKAIGVLSVVGLATVGGIFYSAHAQQATGTPAEDKSPKAGLKVGIVDTVGTQSTLAVARQIPRKGWVPYVKVIVHFPGIDTGDMLMMQFKKGNKKIGKPYACAPREVRTEYQDNQTTPVYKLALAKFDCEMPESYVQTKKGNYTVDLAIRQTLMEKTTPIGDVEIKTIDIFHGSQNNQRTLQTTVLDSIVGPAIAWEDASYTQARSLKPVIDAHHRASMQLPHNDSMYLNLQFWDKGTEAHSRYTVACLYDGKKVADASSLSGGFNSWSTEYWSFKGKKDKDNVYWRQNTFQMRNLRIRHAKNRGKQNNNPNWHYFDQNPGEYVCKFMKGGEIKGSVKFEVRDGHVVRNACTDSINVPNNVTVLPFADRGVSTVKLDKKLQKRAFFGPNKWARGCPPK